MEKKNKEFTKAWGTLDLRTGVNPRRLQDLEKEGMLDASPDMIDEDMEYFQGKYHFTTEEIEYFEEVFNFFDKRGMDQIKTSELGLAIRSAGGLLTEQEIELLKKKVDPYDSQSITFNDFLLCMYQISQKDVSEYSIKECFSAFDKDDVGFVQVSEIRHILKNLGEPLNEEEMNLFLANFDILPNNTIAMEDIIKVLNFKPKMNQEEQDDDFLANI